MHYLNRTRLSQQWQQYLKRTCRRVSLPVSSLAVSGRLAQRRLAQWCLELRRPERAFGSSARMASSAAATMATGAMTRSFSRAKLADGRVSLRAHLLGGAEQGRSITGIIRSNLARSQLYPKFVCIGAGLVGAAYFAQRHLLTSPDVKLSGETRRMSIRPQAEHEEMARRFTKHRRSLAGTLPGHTSKAQWPGYASKAQ